jgi:hypothetical protein
MRRAWPLDRFRPVAAVVLGVVFACPLPAQVPVYNSNGFDTGYNTGNLIGQQGFLGEPSNGTAGVIQAQTFQSAGQAFQMAGPNLINNTAFSGGNYWYKSYGFGSGFNPVGSGNAFVQVEYKGRASGSVPLITDIPFAGVYLEGYTNIGLQQSITPIYINLNGGVTVFTNSSTGQNNAVSTDDNLLAREQWHHLYAELNFTTQKFKVYRFGNTNPLVFHSLVGDITEIPFRNTFGATQSLAEIGMLGFYGRDPFNNSPVQPLNNFFIDDFRVTASPTSQPPVPEPGLGLAAAAVGLVGLRLYRRRRAASGA